MSECASVFDAPDLAERILKAAQLAQPIYAAHGWKWGISYRPLKTGEKYEVPTVEEIADTIKRLYDNVLESGRGCSSSGRLSVYVDGEDGEIHVDVELSRLRDEVKNWDGLSREGLTAEC